MRAAGVNRADALQRRGYYPPPPGVSSIYGLEAAGTVVAVGAGVSPQLVGSPVAALLAGGGYAEYVAVDARHTFGVPGGMSFRRGGLPARGCRHRLLKPSAHLRYEP